MKDNEILAESSKRHLQKVFDELTSHKPFICPQAPRTLALGAVFVLGGYQRQSLSVVECFKKSTNSWERCADMSIPRSGVVCVTLALYIYVIGGRNNSVNGNTDCADVECYNPFTNEWKKCAPMSKPRSRAGTGVIDGMIYAVGGAHGPEFHASVER
jgi:kelch-like protein 19